MIVETLRIELTFRLLQIVAAQVDDFGSVRNLPFADFSTELIHGFLNTGTLFILLLDVEE